jgi:hypothetical protein
MPQLIPILGTIFSAIGSAAPVLGGLASAATLGEGIASAVSGPPKMSYTPPVSTQSQQPQVSTPPQIPTTGLPPTISPSTVQLSNATTAANDQARGGGGLSPLFTQLLEGTQTGVVPYTTGQG